MVCTPNFCAFLHIVPSKMNIKAKMGLILPFEIVKSKGSVVKLNGNVLFINKDPTAKTMLISWKLNNFSKEITVCFSDARKLLDNFLF